jgi:hypothetical protein
MSNKMSDKKVLNKQNVKLKENLTINKLLLIKIKLFIN